MPHIAATRFLYLPLILKVFQVDLQFRGAMQNCLFSWGVNAPRIPFNGGELLTDDFHLIYVLEFLLDDDKRSRFLEVLNSNIFENSKELVKKK